MKTLTMIFAVAVTLVATTSHADGFCIKKFQNALRRDSNKTNFYTQVSRNHAGSTQTANSGTAPVQIEQ